MAKGRILGAVSRFLYTVGESIQFRPECTFVPPRSDKEREDQKRTTPFLSYRLRVKSSLAKTSEQSLFLSLLEQGIRHFFNTRTRAFGVLFFVCGFLQVLSYFLLPATARGEDNLIFGVSLIFLTLLCSFTRGDLKDTLRKSFFFRSFLRPLYGVESASFPSERSRDNSFFMVAWGALLALLSILFSPAYVLGAVTGLVLTLFLFHRPEAGLVTLGLSLLFLSERALFALTLFTLLSFLAKCAVGKRSLVFSFFDLPVLVGVLLMGGKEGLLLAALYLLALGLLRSLAWIRRFLTALMLGAFFCAVLLCLRSVAELSLSPALFVALERSGLLPNAPSEGLAAALAVIAPLSVGLFRSAKSPWRHLLSLVTFAVGAFSVFTGGSYGVRIAFVVAFLVMLLFAYRASLLLMVMGGLGITALLRVLPLSVSSRILAFFGLGEKTAATGYLAGLKTQGGVLSVLAFCLLFAYFFYLCFRFSADSTRPEPFPQVLGGLCAMICFGIIAFLPVAFSAVMPLLFVILMSLPRVALSAARREQIRLPY